MKNTNIKLRTLFTVLSILAILSFIVGGYLYYSALTKFSIERAHNKVSEQLQIIGNDIDSYLTWSLLSVKSLAGLKEIKKSVLSGDANNLDETNTILDRFRDDFEVSVCYLMNRSGKTIASSNRSDANTFVGKNYGFRPYFKQSMQGIPTVYLALGVTSKKRGIYYSHPIYGENKQTPLGVAVIKALIGLIEKNLITSGSGIVLLIDPHGVVFFSSRIDWLYQILWKPSPKLTSDIAKTKQFGRGPWNWTGMKLIDEDNAVNDLGNKYRVHRQKLANYPGWQLVSLNSDIEVMEKITEPLRKSVGFGIAILCVIFGLIVCFLFIKANISILQRNRIEEELKESEKRFKALHNASFGGISIHDKGIILDCNQGLSDMTGFSIEELIGMDGLQLIALEWRDLVREKIQSGFEWPYDIKGLRKDNTKYYARIQAKNIPYHGRIVRITEFRDITESKLAEKEKIKAQKIAGEQKKLALVGQVAGKMAHDFNNILGVIMGNTELSLMDCKEEETKRTLELIFEQTIRGKNLTKNLVAFAKDQEPKQEFFRVSEKIELVVNLMKKDLDGIEFIKEDKSGVPDLLADPGMIEHALVNLIQNSIHATSMSEHPQIKIKTYCLNDKICFEIEDNGCGISEENLENIYEPSFTLKGTKDITGSYGRAIKGTGYGMTNVKKYIEQHKGNISVKSEFGSSTKFTIRLPVIKKELTNEEKIEIQKGKICFDKSILLVEDEPAISGVQYRILSQEPCNHKVDIANDGQVAMDLFKRNKYDLISLDYILPGKINGMDVYNHLRETNKKIPILFISGNIEFLESIKELKQKDANIDHLSKPCQNKDYVNGINKLLERTLSAQE